MAIMYPSRLPDRVLRDRRLKGEIKTYEALSALSDEFEIFYNRCPSAGNHSRAYKRRIDFIVLHEKMGLLAIEVKGGGIRLGREGFEQYHPSSKRWASIDPHKQVEISTIDLIKTVKADGANYYITDNTCVVFPDTLRRDITNTPQSLPNGTLCADDLVLLPTLMKTLFGKSQREQVWARDAFLDMRRRLQNMPEASERDEDTTTTAVPTPPLRKKQRTYATSQGISYPKVKDVTPAITSIRHNALPLWLDKSIDWALVVMAVILIGFGILWLVRHFY